MWSLFACCLQRWNPELLSSHWTHTAFWTQVAVLLLLHRPGPPTHLPPPAGSPTTRAVSTEQDSEPTTGSEVGESVARREEPISVQPGRYGTAGPPWNSRATVEQPGHHGKAAVRQGRDAKGNRAWSSKLGTLRISPAIILCVLRHRQRTD